MHRYARISTAGVALAIPLAAQSVLYLPQIVDGPASGATLRTTIVVTNTAATTNTVRVTLTDDNGAPRKLTFPALGATGDFTLTLKPGATRVLQSDGSGDGSGGGATVKGSAQMAVSEIVSIYGADGSLAGQSSSEAPDIAAAYVVPVDTTGGLNTGVALLNPTGGPSAMTFTLFDPAGANVESVSATLAAGAHSVRTVADLFPDISNFQGTLAVTATNLVAALGVRQDSAAASYSILAATPLSSMLLNQYLPELADGPTANGVQQTSLLIYNLSSAQADVTLAFSQDSGAPWIVNIPGAGANNNFTLQLPPGGSTIWQTDGQGVATTGAAVISSTQPLGVAAIVTASDSQGNFVNETTMSPAAPLERFQVPIDVTDSFNAGAAFYNSTSQPVTLTLNLLDQDGNSQASTNAPPLAPGAHMTAYLSDLFPGAGGAAISATASGGVGASVSAVALRQNAAAGWMAGSPVAPRPNTGAAINVTPALDSTHKATGTIPPAGGSLALTDAKGNKFTLTLPANALLTSQTITMTAVSSLAGLPSGGTFAVGVQLEPDGLALYQPATLTIEPAAPIAADTLIPLGWHSTGQGVYLNLVDPKASKLTMNLLHFSGAGFGSGSDAYLTQQLVNIANAQDLASSQVSYWINKARSQQLQGQDGSAAFKRALEIMSDAYVDIEHLMQLGLESRNDSVLRCAATHAIEYERQRQLLGSNFDGETIAVNRFLSTALGIVAQHALDLCTSTHDPLAGLDLLGFERQAQLLGIPSVLGPLDILTVLNQCAPNPTLNYTAETKGNDLISAGPATANAALDAKTSAKLTLTGKLPPGGTAYDGTGDGYLSYQLSGSGLLKYDGWAASGQSSAAGVGVVCTITTGLSIGSTLTVQSPKSQIQYQFTPKYNPQAPISGANGAVLAQYCPVYDKSAVGVTLAMDPGNPADVAVVTCVGQASTIEVDWALLGWKSLHGLDGGVVTDWQIPGGNSFAHKEATQTRAVPAPLSGSVTETETMDLNQPQQQ